MLQFYRTKGGAGAFHDSEEMSEYQLNRGGRGGYAEVAEIYPLLRDLRACLRASRMKGYSAPSTVKTNE